MQAAKERLAVPKKLLACNTVLQLHDRFIGYSENEAQLKHSYIHRYIFLFFLTSVVPVFALTLLLYPSFTPVKIVAYDL